MTRTLLILSALAGLLAGCATPATPPQTAISQFTSTPVAGLPQCSKYGAAATIDGKQQPLTGEACRQPDGSWHIAEQPAASTIVYQTTYWPPEGALAYNSCFASAYYTPCLYDFPFGFSVGFPVFIDIHHHFHHFVDAGQFRHFGSHGNFGPRPRLADAGSFHDGLHSDFAAGIHGGFSGGGFHHR